MSVTTEEAAAVNAAFEFSTTLPGTGYRVVPASNDEQGYLLIHKRLPNQTNLVSLGTAGDIIEDFRPRYLMLIGTAGGHSDRDGVSLGDVVVANYVDYSGYWKYKDGAALERKLPHDHPSGHLLENYVEPLRMEPERWTQKIRAQRPEAGRPKLLVGGIVSGNILYGDPQNQEQRRILDHFDKAYAFEMEGYGVSMAVYRSRSSVLYNPQYLVVRGISDLVDRDPAENQANRQAWTPYAVAAAAAFARVIVDDLLATDGITLPVLQAEGQSV